MSRCRRLATLLLAGAAAACSDGLAPGGFEGVRVLLSLQGPAAVSEAEIDALDGAFDRIDAYEVIVADSVDGSVIVSESFAISAVGPDAHELSIELPGSAAGRAVLVTVVGRDGGLELYRTAGYTRVQVSTSPTPVVLPLRYTGPGLRGTVVDVSGEPLGNVTVELFQGAAPFASVTTEEDGTYLFLPTSEGGALSAGTYQVRPLPPGQHICPAVRTLTVTSTSALLANFTAQDTPCEVDLLVVSGGDLDDTHAVGAIFAQTPGVTTQTFYLASELPGLAYLSQFDVVLLLANGQFNESVALGSEIAGYVGAGGNVVIASFYWQNRSDSNLDSPGWGALEAIDPLVSAIDPTTGVGGATYQAAALGQVTTGDAASGDALVQGIATLSSTGFRGGVAAAPGATVVAEWSDGQPLIAYRILTGGQRLVAISLFPASGAAASGDTQALWENAVRWAGEAGGPGGPASTQSPVFDSTPTGTVVANAHGSQIIASGASTRVFDDFTLSESRTITRVQWQGIYCVATASAPAPAPTASEFSVTIHADVAASPNEAQTLATGTYTIGRVAETHLTTFVGTCGTATTSIPLYSYSVTLDSPFVATAGVRYWLTVRAHTPDYTVFWGWRSGTTSNGRSLQITSTGATNVFTTDRAFALIGQ